MGLLEKIKFHVWDDVGFVVSLIQKWQPRGCKTEKDYERSLYEHLHENLDDLQVTKQFAFGRAHADICVADKVIVEIKKDLNTTAKYQRLVGQLAEYKRWHGRIVVLLIGDTDKSLRKQLDRHLADEGLSDEFMVKVTVVQK
jgi:hypothetical protein